MGLTEREQATAVRLPTATKRLGVDLASGTAAGVSQLLVGHPFDTIKVRMQVGCADVTALAATRSIASHGVAAFYRGLAAPLTTVSAFNAILFSSRGAAERVLASDGAPLSIWQTMLAGGLAGFPVAMLATPTELLKCRLQAADGRAVFSGPLQVCRHVVSQEGGPLALYRGLGATLLREVPGNMAYFGAYEVLKSWLARWQGLPVPQLGAASLMLAGGISGAAFWSLTYPIDVAKSRIQCQHVLDPHSPPYRGTWDCAARLYRSQGWRALWRGFLPCIIRSVPANAAAFLAYENVSAALTTHC